MRPAGGVSICAASRWPDDGAEAPCLKNTLKRARSPVHGYGCFATAPIAAGTIIGYCDTKPTRKPGMYTLSLPEEGQVDVTCVLRYINH